MIPYGEVQIDQAIKMTAFTKILILSLWTANPGFRRCTLIYGLEK